MCQELTGSGRNNCFSRYFLLASGIAVLFFASAGGQANGVEQDADMLRRIDKALEARRQTLNPIWVTYELDYSETAFWQQINGKKKDVGDESWRVEAAVAWKGEKHWSWAKSERARLPEDNKESFVVFNGEVEIRPSNEKDVFMLRRRHDGNQVAETPFGLVGEDLVRSSVKLWVEGKMKVILKWAESVEADKKIGTLEFSTPDRKWKGKYIFLLDRGFLLRRFEHSDGDGKPLDRGEALEFREFEGISIPVRGKMEHFAQGGKLCYSTTFQVRSVETKAGNIPDRLFQFELPPQSKFWDEDLKVMVRDTEATESHLKEIVARLTPRPVWKDWLLVGGGLAFASAFGFVLMRWRRARRAGGFSGGDKRTPA